MFHRPHAATSLALAMAASVCAWPAQADAPAGTYTTTDATATDTHTGLEWQRLPAPAAATQAAAATYCTGLGAGWRLPSVLELTSLVDEARTGATGTPRIDPTFTCRAEYFWSGTHYATVTSPVNGWVVNFDTGATISQPTTTAAQVRCVR